MEAPTELESVPWNLQSHVLTILTMEPYKTSACYTPYDTTRQELNPGRMGVEPNFLRRKVLVYSPSGYKLALPRRISPFCEPISSFYLSDSEDKLSIPFSHREPPAVLERFYHITAKFRTTFSAHRRVLPVVFATTCKPTGATLVRDTRFELVTSWVQTKHSNRLS